MIMTIPLFKEKCKAIYKMPKEKIDSLIYVLDNLDHITKTGIDDKLKFNCKQAYNVLLDYDELKASFLEMIKMKKKMSEFMAVVSDGNPVSILEKNSLT